jgi:hypothetical protein
LAKPNDLQFLDHLTPPNELIAFMAGYDTMGKWNYTLANNKLMSLNQEKDRLCSRGKTTNDTSTINKPDIR